MLKNQGQSKETSASPSAHKPTASSRAKQSSPKVAPLPPKSPQGPTPKQQPTSVDIQLTSFDLKPLSLSHESSLGLSTSRNDLKPLVLTDNSESNKSKPPKPTDPLPELKRASSSEIYPPSQSPRASVSKKEAKCTSAEFKGCPLVVHLASSSLWPLKQLTSLREMSLFSKFQFVEKSLFEGYLTDVNFPNKSGWIDYAINKASKFKSDYPLTDLELHHIAMISLYTMEPEESQKDCFYAQLNCALRTRQGLEPFMDALYLIDQGLKLLPKHTQELRKGVSPTVDLSKHEIDSFAEWAQFSTTVAESKTEEVIPIGSESCTFYTLKLSHCYDISSLSLPQGPEYLIPLGSVFKIDSIVNNSEIVLSQTLTPQIFGSIRRTRGAQGAESLDVWNLLRSAAFHAIVFSKKNEEEKLATTLWEHLRKLEQVAFPKSKEPIKVRQVAAQVLARAVVEGIPLPAELITELSLRPSVFLTPHSPSSYKQLTAAVYNMSQRIHHKSERSTAVAQALTLWTFPGFEGMTQAIALALRGGPEENWLEYYDNPAPSPAKLPPFVNIAQIRLKCGEKVSRLSIFHAILPTLCFILLHQRTIDITLLNSASGWSFIASLKVAARGLFDTGEWNGAQMSYELLYQQRLRTVCSQYLGNSQGSTAELEVRLAGFKDKVLTPEAELFVHTVTFISHMRAELSSHQLALIMGNQKAGKSTFSKAMGLIDTDASATSNTRDVSVHTIPTTNFHFVDCPATNDISHVRNGLGRLLGHTADAAVVFLHATDPNNEQSRDVLKMLSAICKTNNMAVAIIFNRVDQMFENISKDIESKDQEMSEEEVCRRTSDTLFHRVSMLIRELESVDPFVQSVEIYLGAMFPRKSIRELWIKNNLVSPFDADMAVPLNSPVKSVRDEQKILGPRGAAAVLAQMCNSLGPNVFRILDSPESNASYARTWPRKT